MTGVYGMETTINATCMVSNKLVAKVYNKKLYITLLTAKVLTYKTLRIFMQSFLFYRSKYFEQYQRKAED